MKAPLRAAAKVAEKLRNWLTSELEPHGIYNIDQYAHHVVTIFLNEDLDIEDEPLGTVGDFLKDVFSLRSGKSLERKKKAAVELLKSVISCDKPVETEIVKIIDELIVRIEATKDDKPSPRKLLGPLTLNVGSTGYKQSTRRNRIEQERRYNEAFPSLSGEIEKSNLGAAVPSSKGHSPEVWQKSPINKENSVRNGKQVKAPQAASNKFMFSDANEKQACLTASQVFSLAIPGGNLPSPLSMEVESTSQTDMSLSCSKSPNAFDTCWKSAFQSVVPTKLFSPNSNSLPFDHGIANVIPTTFQPFIIHSDHRDGFQGDHPDSFHGDHPDSFCTLLKYVDLFDPNAMKVFLHPQQESPDHRPSPEMLFARDANDLEVANIIAWAQINREQVRRRQNKRDEEERRKRNCERREEDKNGMEEVGHQKMEDEEVKLSPSCNDELGASHSPSAVGGAHWNGLSNDTDNLHPIVSSQQQSKASDDESDTSSDSSSPLLGAVGGNTTDSEDEEGEIVDTDDVLSFALRQLAKYEMKHGKVLDEVEVNNNVYGLAKFELDVDEMDNNNEADRNEKSIDQSTCSSRTKIGSIDSGMYANGEEESGASAIEDKFSSPNESSHDYEKTPSFDTDSTYSLPVSTMAAWRKTPGSLLSGDDLISSAESTLSGGGNESYADVTIADCIDKDLELSGWNEWTDPLSGNSWDSMIREEIYHLISPSRASAVLEHRNIFRPPVLSSCVDTNVSQILQSAYVNSMFAEAPPTDTVCQFKDSSLALNCADLEQIWLSTQSQEVVPSTSHQDVVRGKTCSNWLENTCDLGGTCPFSHPTI